MLTLHVQRAFSLKLFSQLTTAITNTALKSKDIGALIKALFKGKHATGVLDGMSDCTGLFVKIPDCFI